MSNPYFLTRQTANLMEDFSSALKEGGALYLLYGAQGVGKTRLLRELRDRRLGEVHVHWIDMRGVSDGQIVQLDRSRRIEEIFANAENGDVVIADHFEFALKKTRHQLFLSWSADGQDKGISLIVASADEGLDELQQLAQHYKVEVRGFRLEPFERDEVDAFLAFHLFPEHPLGRLEVPAPLRRQLDAAGGKVAKLIELADHDGSQIRILTLDERDPVRFGLRSGVRLVVALLCLSAIVAAFGWYLTNRPEPSLASAEPAAPVTSTPSASAPESTLSEATEIPPPPTAPVAEAPDIAETTVTEGENTLAGAGTDGFSGGVDAAVEAADEAEVAAATETVSANSVMMDEGEPLAPAAQASGSAAPAQESEPEEETVPLEGDDAVESSPETVAPAPVPVAAGPETETETETETAGTASDTKAVLIGADAVEPAAAVSPAPAEEVGTRFQRRIEASLDWLNGRAATVGTVQILLLAFDGFDPDAYFENVERLAQGGVDPDQVYIVRTLTAGRAVYSVFYSEYPSRQAAHRSISELPEVLRELKPIARSVGGIQQEIRRLEG